MSAERRKILEMLAAGKITSDEAERLLERLDGPAAPVAAPEGEGTASAGGPSPRFLRVVVDSPERESVNVRLPLGLIRTGLKLSTILPGRVSRRLSERGIDLSHLGSLDDEGLIAELAALQVDVSGEDGETVRVYCGRGRSAEPTRAGTTSDRPALSADVLRSRPGDMGDTVPHDTSYTYAPGMLSIRLDPEIEQRLSDLAARTGRTKSFYAREAIIAHLDEMEDRYIAIDRLEKPARRWPLEEVERGDDLDG
ncbi:MAG: TraY domain-containing protein [Thermoanaerobaculia bacterium]